MGVGRRCARGFIFLLAQDFAEVFGGLREFFGRVPIEGAGERSPSGVTREEGFLRIGRITVVRFQGFERADGGDIIAGFLGETALSDAVLRR
jgi:hypothetical protein